MIIEDTVTLEEEDNLDCEDCWESVTVNCRCGSGE